MDFDFNPPDSGQTAEVLPEPPPVKKKRRRVSSDDSDSEIEQDDVNVGRAKKRRVNDGSSSFSTASEVTDGDSSESESDFDFDPDEDDGVFGSEDTEQQRSTRPQRQQTEQLRLQVQESDASSSEQSEQQDTTFWMSDAQANQAVVSQQQSGNSGSGFTTATDLQFANLAEVERVMNNVSIHQFRDDQVQYENPNFCYLCYVGASTENNTFRQKLVDMLDLQFGRVQESRLAADAQKYYDRMIRPYISGRPPWPQKQIIKHLTSHAPTPFASAYKMQRYTDLAMSVIANQGLFQSVGNSKFAVDSQNAVLMIKFMDMANKIATRLKDK